MSDGINRRTLLASTAWSVPVIAVAVATPLAAASTALLDVGIAVYSYSDVQTNLRVTANNPSDAPLEVTVVCPRFPPGSIFRAITPDAWTYTLSDESAMLVTTLAPHASNVTFYITYLAVPNATTTTVSVVASAPGYAPVTPTVQVTFA